MISLADLKKRRQPKTGAKGPENMQANSLPPPKQSATSVQLPKQPSDTEAVHQVQPQRAKTKIPPRNPFQKSQASAIGVKSTDVEEVEDISSKKTAWSVLGRAMTTQDLNFRGAYDSSDAESNVGDVDQERIYGNDSDNDALVDDDLDEEKLLLKSENRVSTLVDTALKSVSRDKMLSERGRAKRQRSVSDFEDDEFDHLAITDDALLQVVQQPRNTQPEFSASEKKDVSKDVVPEVENDMQWNMLESITIRSQSGLPDWLKPPSPEDEIRTISGHMDYLYDPMPAELFQHCLKSYYYTQPTETAIQTRNIALDTESWIRALRSLIGGYRSGHVKYFYVVHSEFTILFSRCDKEAGSSDDNAWATIFPISTFLLKQMERGGSLLSFFNIREQYLAAVRTHPDSQYTDTQRQWMLEKRFTPETMKLKHVMRVVGEGRHTLELFFDLALSLGSVPQKSFLGRKIERPDACPHLISPEPFTNSTCLMASVSDQVPVHVLQQSTGHMKSALAVHVRGVLLPHCVKQLMEMLRKYATEAKVELEVVAEGCKSDRAKVGFRSDPVSDPVFESAILLTLCIQPLV